MTRKGAKVASDPLSRNYAQLEGHERFVLLVEAMARKDEAEADRLDDTCPRLSYRQDDAEYRDRVQRAYSISMLVTINIRWRLEQVRVARLFMDQHRLYVWGPQLVATTAFLFGRQYGMWECGAIEQIDLPDLEGITAEVKGRPDLREQLKEVREISAEGVRRVAETLQYAVGYAHATEVLSQWEGFGRFCRQTLGLEPMAVMMAYCGGTTQRRRCWPAIPTRLWTRRRRRTGKGIGSGSGGGASTVSVPGVLSGRSWHLARLALTPRTHFRLRAVLARSTLSHPPATLTSRYFSASRRSPHVTRSSNAPGEGRRMFIYATLDTSSPTSFHS